MELVQRQRGKEGKLQSEGQTGRRDRLVLKMYRAESF